MKKPALTLGTRTLGEGQPCLVVALVASAHEGSADTALRMIEAAFKMGADAIAFQVFRAECLLVRRHPMRKDLEAVELDDREWRRVLEAARASGLAVLAEAFDAPSIERASEAGVHALQVHAGDLENPELVRAAAAVRRPVFLSAGGRPDALVREAFDLAGEEVALVHGPTGTPAPAEEMRLREIAAGKERYRVPVGILDASDGGSAFALVAPALAAAHGADFVEKHFTLDRSRKGHDYAASLSPEEFYRMVELLRQAERARGELSPALEARGVLRAQRRSIVAGTLIARGEVLAAPMLAFKRTDDRLDPGLSPREAHRVIGRRAARPIQAEEIIREDMLE
ncbi:MAG TPA: N-acetylneuraminate synthase family protein [Vicinamibacteria bacterium]|nr:N-acetylneuraminate synthase family protein [Vicinamibacteria bacterium]